MCGGLTDILLPSVRLIDIAAIQSSDGSLGPSIVLSSRKTKTIVQSINLGRQPRQYKGLKQNNFLICWPYPTVHFYYRSVVCTV